METHKNLLVWQKSMAFVTELYKLTRKYPKDEQYGLINQLRRAAVSIPSNIAEGCARRNTKQYIQFLYVSLGSASEIETQVIISYNLEYVSNNEEQNMLEMLEEIIRMLVGLIKSLSNRS
jgi:four helix bundle protein